MSILIGTSGYSYDDWRGPFYPVAVSKNKMLEFYAKEFSFTEINSSYYHLPSQNLFLSLAKRTPENFIFSVKAYKTLTHERQESVPEDIKKFCYSLEPLLQAEKLGAVLLQFPYSFHNQEENRRYLAGLKGLFLKSIPLAVEFRHHSWIKEATWDFLRTLEIGYVCVDEPGLKRLVNQTAICASEIAYVRFHGRNLAKWWKHEESYERYDYLYTLEEIGEWTPKINELAKQVKQVYIAFNNHYRGQAVRNARMLRELLQI